jgi:hypothetical protein
MNTEYKKNSNSHNFGKNDANYINDYFKGAKSDHLKEFSQHRESKDSNFSEL